MNSNKLAKEMGNPKAAEEYLVYKHFEQKNLLFEFYKAMFIDWDDNISGADGLNDQQKEIFRTTIAGTRNRINSILKLVDPKPGDRILDAGSGKGPVSIYSTLKGTSVWGLDINLSSIEWALKLARYKSVNISISRGDTTYIPYKNDFFDKVIFADVFEHIHEKSRALLESRRVLRPCGKIYIHTDNETRVQLGVVARQIVAIMSFKNPLKWNAAFSGREGGHVAVVTPSYLLYLAKKIGFRKVEIIFDNSYPLGISRALSGYTLIATK